jgi:DNA-binding SARP family transcriptional activator
MEFKILGPLEVRAGDRDITCKGAKQRLLLSVLLLNANEVVSRDRLVDVLWGDEPPETSKALQMHVSQLRKSLEPGVLVTRPPGYELRVAPADVDVHRFEAAAEQGRAALAAGRPADARRVLEQALALWRGPPFADLTFEECLQGDIARLEELRLAALEARIDADLALGNHAEVIGELEQLAAAHPTRERVRAQLMLALYRSGRQAEALEVYRDTRTTLVDELGIEPGRELQALEGRVLAQDPHLELAHESEPAEALLGRGRELAQLLPLVDRALAGSGGLLLIGGEPGIGKSQLAEAIASRAQDRGAEVLVGRCWEAGGAPAYWPWVQALRGHVGDLAQLGDLLPGPVDSDSEGTRFLLFEAVASLLARSARQTPLAVFLDDIHAADDPSLLLLRFLATQLRDCPLMICCCYRDTEAGADLTAALADLAREPVTHRLTLAGLDEPATARLLEDTMGAAPAEPLLAQVQEGTRGNPLFVAELGRLLAAGEAPVGRLPIPDGVRATIGQRLQRRSVRCRDVLDTASAFGREFELEPLARVCGLPEEQLFAAIDEAGAARFLADVPGAPGRVRFSHVLMRDAIYDQLPAARRMKLHRDIAAALEDRYAGSLETHASELAHHYLLGGSAVSEQAIAFATRAGDHATTQHGHEEAARHYSTALEALERSGPDDASRRCDLLLALGDVLSRAGDLDAAKQAFRRAADLAERNGWHDRLTRAVLGYGGRFAWGRASVDPALVPLLEGALAAIGDEDSAARVRLLGRLAAARRDDASSEVRIRLAYEALAMARRIGDRATLAYALEAKWTATESPATLEGRFERADEQIALSVATGNMELVYGGHDNRFNTFFTLGDRAGLDVELAALGALADELRQPAQRWHVMTAQSLVALLEGRFELAETLAEEAGVVGERTMGWNARVCMRISRFLLRRSQGRLAEVKDDIARAVREYPTLPRFMCALAYLHAELGAERQARELLGTLLSTNLEHEHLDEDWLLGVAMLPDVCARVADDAAAARIYDLLLPYQRLYAEAPNEGTFGAVARGLGVLATQLGRYDDAEGHFVVAIEIERGMLARPWIAHAQHGLGEALLARGED